MKNRVYLVCLTLISQLFCFSGYAGQEGHGGNEIALEFVKIGQALKVLLKQHPEWGVSQVVSPQTLARSINNSFVTTGTTSATGVAISKWREAPKVIFTPDQLDTYDRIGNIYLHTPKWEVLQCDEKYREVFHLYLMQTDNDVYLSRKLNDGHYEISSQFPAGLANGIRCFNSLGQNTLADLSLQEQIKILRHDVANFLNRNSRWVGIKGLRHNSLRSLLNRLLDDRSTDILSTNNLQDRLKRWEFQPWLQEKDIVTFSSDFDYLVERDQLPIYLLPNQESITREREMQLATQYLSNDKSGRGIYIWVNEKRWETFNYDQKFELILHEYLSLFTSVDLYYHASSTIETIRRDHGPSSD
jgi:hypothetical protein